MYKVTEELLKAAAKIGYELQAVVDNRNGSGHDCIDFGGSSPAARFQIWITEKGVGDIYVGQDNFYYNAMRNISQMYGRDKKQRKRHFKSVAGCIEHMKYIYSVATDAAAKRQAKDVDSAVDTLLAMDEAAV